MKLKAMLAGLGASLFLSAPAHAAMPVELIRSFNLALEGDDPSAVIQAAEALIEAAVANPDDPAARGAAFEAGTQLCLRSACDRALAAAPLMTGEGTEDVPASLAALLVSFAEWSADRNKVNGKALMAALQAVAAEPPTYLTIVAFDHFHHETLKANDLSEVRKVAELAAGHLKPVWNVVPENWAAMELSAIATTFARNRDTDVIDRLAKLQVALYPFHLAARKEQPGLTTLYYETMAWRLGVETFFKGRGTRTAGALKAADAYVDAETEAISKAYFKDRPKITPLCTGGYKTGPKPDYPASALRDGYVGAVIVGFNIDEGEIVDLEVLAAVPDRQFEEASLKAMTKVEWYFDEVQKEPDCKRSRAGRPAIQPFMFGRPAPGGGG